MIFISWCKVYNRPDALIVKDFIHGTNDIMGSDDGGHRSDENVTWILIDPTIYNRPVPDPLNFILKNKFFMLS